MHNVVYASLHSHVSQDSPNDRPETIKTGLQLKQCDISSHINLWGHHRIPEIMIRSSSYRA